MSDWRENTDVTGSQIQTPKRRHGWGAPIMLSGLLAVLYVLSYAPVVKWKESTLPSVSATDPHTGHTVVITTPVDGQGLPLYVPVDWLIDHTILRHPLLRWADLWDVGTTFRVMSNIRRGVEVRW
jgi:hypothetical protein